MTYDKQAAGKAAKEEKEKMKETIQEAIKGWSVNPKSLIEYFQFSEKFSYQYSFRNTVLIQQQNRGAVFCQSFAAWKKAGYSVLRGMHGMSIYIPVTATLLEIDGKQILLSEATKEQKQQWKEGKITSKTVLHYRIGTTFDIAQTNFPPDKYPELLSRGIASELHGACVCGLKDYCQEDLKLPVVLEADLDGQIETQKEYGIQGASLYGYYDRLHKEIHIAKTLQDTAALSTLSHEIGHALAHQNREPSENIHQIEFEADAFSIMLQEHFGFSLTEERKEHISEHYRAWEGSAGDDFQPEKSIDRIFGLYRKHIEGIDRKLQKYLPENTIVLERSLPEAEPKKEVKPSKPYRRNHRKSL